MKILIAEDDVVSRHLLESFLLKWGYDVVVARDGAEALLSVRQENPPRIAILDWMMPKMDGIEICRAVRTRQDEPYVYILFLSAKCEMQDVVAGFEAGADDYLIKPFESQELKARLRAGKRIIELQDRLVETAKALHAEATHDSLTGLWNRSAIIEILCRELARSQRQEADLALIMVDLDHFKRVNDTYGHLAGDAVLREVSRRMSSSVRIYDSIGRYGGEEFLVVLPGCNEDNALTLAERLRTSISDEPMDVCEGKISITASLGVGLSCDCKDAEMLMRTADAALYRAKTAGRNRVLVSKD